MTAEQRYTLTEARRELNRRMVFRFTLTTNPLTHKVARTLALAAKWYGLDVTHDHDRSWFDRRNLIVAEGPERDVNRYRLYVDLVEQQIEAAQRETA